MGDVTGFQVLGYGTHENLKMRSVKAIEGSRFDQNILDGRLSNQNQPKYVKREAYTQN